MNAMSASTSSSFTTNGDMTCDSKPLAFFASGSRIDSMMYALSTTAVVPPTASWRRNTSGRCGTEPVSTMASYGAC